MNELFNKLEQVSIGKALIIGVVVAGLYWLLSDDGSSQLNNIANTTQQINSLRNEMTELDTKVKQARQYQLRIDALGSELNDLSSYISEKFSSADLMQKVSGEAKAAGLDILSITEGQSFRGATDQNLYTTFTIQAQLEGSFSQHVLFLSFLTNLKTIVTVGDFSMTSSQRPSNAGADSPLVKFSLNLIGYRYQADVGAQQ